MLSTVTEWIAGSSPAMTTLKVRASAKSARRQKYAPRRLAAGEDPRERQARERGARKTPQLCIGGAFRSAPRGDYEPDSSTLVVPGFGPRRFSRATSGRGLAPPGGPFRARRAGSLRCFRRGAARCPQIGSGGHPVPRRAAVMRSVTRAWRGGDKFFDPTPSAVGDGGTRELRNIHEQRWK